MKILANGAVFYFYGCRKNQAHWWMMMMMMMIHFPGRSLATFSRVETGWFYTLSHR